MNEQITSKINEILNVLSNSNLNNIALLTGNTGISLFEFYLSEVQKNETLKETAAKRIENVFNEIENGTSVQFSYCNGLAGLGWFLEFAGENNLYDYDTNAILEDIDDYLAKMLKIQLNAHHWDFLHGAVGIGYYFLSRFDKNEKVFENLEIIVEFLEKTAFKDENNNLFWKTFDKDKNIITNISLSHGMSSIVMFLLKVAQKNILTERVEKLLFSSVDFILSQEVDKERYGNYFPSYSKESEERQYSSRLGWCYGDLGIATTIYNVGKHFNKQNLIDKAIEVLLYTANCRRDLTKNYIVDAGLCHGAAGVAAIFYRMWWNTQISDFKNAADYWIEKTLEIAKFHDGLAGYKAYRSEEYGGWVNEYSVLEGVAGIGLILASYLYEAEPKWDKCLLIN